MITFESWPPVTSELRLYRRIEQLQRELAETRKLARALLLQLEELKQTPKEPV